MVIDSPEQLEHLFGKEWHERKWIDTRDPTLITNLIQIQFPTAKEVIIM